jgi:hypothetical protein
MGFYTRTGGIMEEQVKYTLEMSENGNYHLLKFGEDLGFANDIEIDLWERLKALERKYYQDTK